MKIQIRFFCGEIKNMVSIDEEEIKDNGFWFKEHDRVAIGLDLTEEEQSLSEAYIIALEKTTAFFQEKISADKKLFDNITKRMMELDAEHREHRQEHADKIKEEAEMIDCIMEILPGYSIGTHFNDDE